jgi:hypothetical protein
MRDEEQNGLLHYNSPALCVSLSVANKHSCLNKVVGTMPGPIGGARGGTGGEGESTYTY